MKSSFNITIDILTHNDCIIDEHPKEWQSVKRKVTGKSDLALTGDSLKRAPKGFSPEHKLIEDLKRKDFIAVCPLPVSAIYSSDFEKQIASLFKKSAPLMDFLCTADDLMF